jgi:hypothetical protein
LDPNDPIIFQSLRGKQIASHSKASFVSQRNPININTQETLKLDYNIVEELNKLKDNVSVMVMCMIPQENGFLLQPLKSIESPITRTDLGEVPSPKDLKDKPNVNAFSLDKRGNPFVPPFLLMFEVFNRNFHNCLVNSRAPPNVMPFSSARN